MIFEINKNNGRQYIDKYELLINFTFEMNNNKLSYLLLKFKKKYFRERKLISKEFYF